MTNFSSKCAAWAAEMGNLLRVPVFGSTSSISSTAAAILTILAGLKATRRFDGLPAALRPAVWCCIVCMVCECVSAGVTALTSSNMPLLNAAPGFCLQKTLMRPSSNAQLHCTWPLNPPGDGFGGSKHRPCPAWLPVAVTMPAALPTAPRIEYLYACDECVTLAVNQPPRSRTVRWAGGGNVARGAHQQLALALAVAPVAAPHTFLPTYTLPETPLASDK